MAGQEQLYGQTMPNTRPNSAYGQGVRDSLPFIFAVTPFALLFGVVATEAGLNVAQTLGFSIVVIAGAAQFAAVKLMVDDAPTLIIVATALIVNLRMAMYSASLTPYVGQAPLWKRAMLSYLLVDQSYVMALAKYERSPDMTPGNRLAYFFGTMTPILPAWYGMTLAGALVGARIPPEFALDFAVPIMFLAMVAPMLRSAAHIAAALTSVTLALCFAFLPYNLGLMVAALGAMIVGAQVETLIKRTGP
jgi:predicted branched-subunit amino acid permease